MNLQWLTIRLLGLFAGPVEFVLALLEKIHTGTISSKPYLNMYEKVDAIDSGVSSSTLVVESVIYLIGIFVLCLIIGIFIKKDDIYFKKTMYLFGFVLTAIGCLGLVSRIFTWLTPLLLYPKNVYNPFIGGSPYYELQGLKVSFLRDIIFLVLGLIIKGIFNKDSYQR